MRALALASLALPALVALALGCTPQAQAPPGDGGDDGGGDGVVPAGLVQPAGLVYRGAFRLPDASGGSSWSWSGDAAAYYPGGEPGGPNDGYPGSIFGTGNDIEKQVSEVSIPAPVVSAAHNVDELNTATTLQPFTDVRVGVGHLDAYQEIIRTGLAYLPAQGAQTSGKLYLCWGQHFHESEAEQQPTHMWCELDLTGSQGAWRVGDYSFYRVNDYMCDVPESWATANTPGQLLATGRFRDGGWGGQGPNLFTIGPWNQGNPPPDGTVLDATQLLGYSNNLEDPEPYHVMYNYHHADAWMGVAWLTAADRAAVVFVGTKGTGDCWYGLPDGSLWEPPYPPDPENQRGWWSTGFVAQMLFYDPSDLAAVAAGTMEPWEPQPYATMDLTDRLFNVTGTQQKYQIGACCFDRERGHLYVFETFGDGDKPLVHVWDVT